MEQLLPEEAQARHQERDDRERAQPSAFNGAVSVRGYRIVMAEIPELPEVYLECLVALYRVPGRAVSNGNCRRSKRGCTNT